MKGAAPEQPSVGASLLALVRGANIVRRELGLDEVYAGLKKVWASPFSYRSFSWRQTVIEVVPATHSP